MTKTSREETEKLQAEKAAELKPLGLYVHIPFCVRKCRYCDFVSFPGCDGGVVDAYADRLCEEIALRGAQMKERYYVDTVFFGGGTPSLLSAAQLKRIKDAVVCAFYCGNPEFTIECNPGTVDGEKLRAFREQGVNRISLGVQSLSNPVLKRLGRIHSSETAIEAMRLCRSTGLSFNADLMFGVPGQTLRIWKDTLKRTLTEEPDHISFYSLQLEEGTPMCEDYRMGDLELPSWEENREMYHFAVDCLKEQGYRHYEISNAAKEGRECRHNLKYWHMEEYLGVGLAAHSFIDLRRTSNTTDLDKYLYSPADYLFGASIQHRHSGRNGESGPVDVRELKGDFVFTELRLVEGFKTEDYRKMFNSGFAEDFGEAFTSLIEEGLLTAGGGRVALSEAGRDSTNPVMERLLEAI